MSGIPNHYDTKRVVSFHLQRVERKEKRKRKEKKMQEENAKGPRAGGSARNS